MGDPGTASRGEQFSWDMPALSIHGEQTTATATMLNHNTRTRATNLAGPTRAQGDTTDETYCLRRWAAVLGIHRHYHALTSAVGSTISTPSGRGPPLSPKPHPSFPTSSWAMTACSHHRHPRTSDDSCRMPLAWICYRLMPLRNRIRRSIIEDGEIRRQLARTTKGNSKTQPTSPLRLGAPPRALFLPIHQRPQFRGRILLWHAPLFKGFGFSERFRFFLGTFMEA